MKKNCSRIDSLGRCTMPNEKLKKCGQSQKKCPLRNLKLPKEPIFAEQEPSGD